MTAITLACEHICIPRAGNHIQYFICCQFIRNKVRKMPWGLVTNKEHCLCYKSHPVISLWKVLCLAYQCFSRNARGIIFVLSVFLFQYY